MELVYLEAILRAWLHQKDAAFELLGRYYASNVRLRQLLREEPSTWWLEDLWTDPRWRELSGR